MKTFYEECAWRQEVKMLSKVRHAHIHVQKVEAIGTKKIVSTFYVGSLDQCHGHGRVELELAVKFIKEMCAGLKFVHDAGVVHRDVHGGNVFLEQHGPDLVCVIGDFGLSLDRSGLASILSDPSSSTKVEKLSVGKKRVG